MQKGEVMIMNAKTKSAAIIIFSSILFSASGSVSAQSTSDQGQQQSSANQEYTNPPAQQIDRPQSKKRSSYNPGFNHPSARSSYDPGFNNSKVLNNKSPVERALDSVNTEGVNYGDRYFQAHLELASNTIYNVFWWMDVILLITVILLVLYIYHIMQRARTNHIIFVDVGTQLYNQYVNARNKAYEIIEKHNRLIEIINEIDAQNNARENRIDLSSQNNEDITKKQREKYLESDVAPDTVSEDADDSNQYLNTLDDDPNINDSSFVAANPKFKTAIKPSTVNSRQPKNAMDSFRASQEREEAEQARIREENMCMAQGSQQIAAPEDKNKCAQLSNKVNSVNKLTAGAVLLEVKSTADTIEGRNNIQDAYQAMKQRFVSKQDALNSAISEKNKLQEEIDKLKQQNNSLNQEILTAQMIISKHDLSAIPLPEMGHSPISIKENE